MDERSNVPVRVQGSPWTKILTAYWVTATLVGLEIDNDKVVPVLVKDEALNLSKNAYSQLPVQIEGMPLVFTNTFILLLAVFKNR